MNTSTTFSPGELLDQMAGAAKQKFQTDSGWAEASGLPKETLSRLKKNPSCDLRTLGALARTAGYKLIAVPDVAEVDGHFPTNFGRDEEDALLDLCASGVVDPDVWRASGSTYFMAGLAVMLAGARGFERERYMRLAETLHPGISTPEVFGMWLKQTPISISRFLPMARMRKGVP
jgi:hypothetical protein